MSQPQIDHNDDLRRLREEGFEVDVRDSYLIVGHVPYVCSSRTVKYGTLISTLSLAGDRTTRPDTHVVYFIGEFPCHRDGTPIEQLRHQSARQQLTMGLTVDHSFSNKPPNGYTDYYDKIATYINVISSPASALDPRATPRTFAHVGSENVSAPFVYADTNSSRYGIVEVAGKLRGLKVGIVGVGGTGSYVLDLVAKTPVAAIHLFDGDQFVSHNAFRAPGAAAVEELRLSPLKTEYLANVYKRMHSGVVSHPYFIDRSNCEELGKLDFVFSCVDKGSVKRIVFEQLRGAKVPFVDVGMGVEMVDTMLIGIVRTTAVPRSSEQDIDKRVPFQDDPDDLYRTPIQIADLNMLNAALAVIKWKKMMGVYQDMERETNSTYSLNVNMLVNDDHAA